MSGRVNIKTIIKGLLCLSRMQDISVCIKVHMRNVCKCLFSIYSRHLLPVFPYTINVLARIIISSCTKVKKKKNSLCESPLTFNGNVEYIFVCLCSCYMLNRAYRIELQYSKCHTSTHHL